jgi:FkbM family methyltransferase
MDGLIASDETLVARLGKRILSRLRMVRIRFSDPCVHYVLDGVRIRLPLSHDLPLYQKAHPQYGRNLISVVSRLVQSYPQLSMIDIGANIGDSAIMVHQQFQIPILCIEGEARFYTCLQENTNSVEHITIERAFIGAEGDRASSLEMQRGTARLILEDGGAGRIEIRTLSDVIKKHTEFQDAKLWKIDAEGFDCRIIHCESALISRARPVIFFEYDPCLAREVGTASFSVFSALEDLGYRMLMVYQNTGAYLISVRLSETAILQDLDNHCRKVCGYCDLVAFHEEDVPVATAIRDSEIHDA